MNKVMGEKEFVIAEERLLGADIYYKCKFCGKMEYFGHFRSDTANIVKHVKEVHPEQVAMAILRGCNYATLVITLQGERNLVALIEPPHGERSYAGQMITSF